MRFRMTVPPLAIPVGCVAWIALSPFVTCVSASVDPPRERLGAPSATQIMPRVADDGAGGMFTAWLDLIGATGPVYAQRFTRDGDIAPGWPAPGTPVSGSGSLDNVAIVADGVGGVYIAWDTGGLYGDLGLSHVDAGGRSAALSIGGIERTAVRLSAGGGATPQKFDEGDAYPVMVSDGAGGVVCAWQHSSELFGNAILVQRFAVGGGAVAPVWASWLRIDSSFEVAYPVIASDGGGGAFVAWVDRYPIRQVYVNHVTADGDFAPGWPRGGVKLCPLATEQTAPGIVPDGVGGAIIAWADSRDSTHDQVFAQRVTAEGQRAWPESGICVCSQPLNFGPNRFGWYGGADARRGPLVSDGSGGALAVWVDYRNGATGSDVYAQRIAADGSIADGWPVDGAPICVEPGDRQLPAIASDGHGGAYVAWQDGRAQPTWTLRSQHLDARGQTVSDEPAGGVVISATPDRNWLPVLSPDGEDGAFVAWVDRTDSLPSIHASHRASGGAQPVRPPSTLTLSSDLNPAREGRTITLTATVQPASAAGTVDFYELGRRFATVPIVGGVATAQHLLAVVGLRTLAAVYSGDAAYGPSSAFIVEQAVPRLLSTLSLASSQNPGLVGRPVTLTAIVQPATASGMVDFFDSDVRIGTGTLVGGVATISSVLPQTPGMRALSAAYAGDTAYVASSASFMQRVLIRFSTHFYLAPSANPSTSLDVTFTARLSPALASGNLVFSDDGGTLATVPLVNGVAVFPYHAPRFCTRTITASYPGDSICEPCVRVHSQQFSGQPTTTTLTSSANPDTVGQPFTLTATVQPSGASGSVSFLDFWGNPIADATLVNGVASSPCSFALPASGYVTARYSGDTTYSESAGLLLLDIIRFATTTALASTVNPSVEGARARFTATLYPPPDEGRMTFYVDGVSQASASVSGGVATFATESLGAGSHAIVAEYSGATRFAGSVSSPLLQRVTARAMPYLRVLSPNDGETWFVGSPVQIRWEVVNRALVPRVSLFLSRTPPAWEPIAEDVPNTGSYTWVVTGPGTNIDASPVASARVFLIALSGAIDGDTSDLPFSIFDASTEAVVTRLDAEPIDAGVRVSWALGSRASFTSLELQRASAEVGPWLAVAVEVRDESGLSVAEDRTAEAGLPYWYRLLATAAGGAQSIFGPISATAGGPREFALSAAWPNPSKGPLALRFTVANHARVKLGIIDLTGRVVTVLTEGDYEPGRYQVDWDGRNAGAPVPAGVYFVQYLTPGGRFVRRVTIVP